jgi:hypothetical protein
MSYMFESWSWAFPLPTFSFWPFDLGIFALGLTSSSTLKRLQRKSPIAAQAEDHTVGIVTYSMNEVRWSPSNILLALGYFLAIEIQPMRLASDRS